MPQLSSYEEEDLARAIVEVLTSQGHDVLSYKLLETTKYMKESDETYKEAIKRQSGIRLHTQNISKACWEVAWEKISEIEGITSRGSSGTALTYTYVKPPTPPKQFSDISDEEKLLLVENFELVVLGKSPNPITVENIWKELSGVYEGVVDFSKMSGKDKGGISKSASHRGKITKNPSNQKEYIAITATEEVEEHVPVTIPPIMEDRKTDKGEIISEKDVHNIEIRGYPILVTFREGYLVVTLPEGDTILEFNETKVEIEFGDDSPLKGSFTGTVKKLTLNL